MATDQTALNMVGQIDLNDNKLVGGSSVDGLTTTSPTTWTALKSYSIPTDRLSSRQAVRITAWGKFTGTNGTKDARISFGATTFAITQVAGANEYDWAIEALVHYRQEGANAQAIFARSYQNGALDVVDERLLASEDNTAGAIVVSVDANLASGSDSVALGGFVVEIIDGGA